MSDAISSFGTLLQIGDGGGPENFTTIGEVKDISGPDLKLNTEDVTNHSSPGGWMEKVGTLLEAGTVDFDINYVPTEATHDATTGLLADMIARTKRNFKLVFPDAGATTWPFTAIVANFKPGAPVSGVLTATVSLEVTGSVAVV